MGKINRWLYKYWPVTWLSQYERDELLKAFKSTTTAMHASAGRSNELGDLLAAKTLELESLKNKIVEKAQTATTIKAKSAAEIRSLMDRAQELEFEEQTNGI